jgi:hypothetical protein
MAADLCLPVHLWAEVLAIIPVQVKLIKELVAVVDLQ